MIPQEYNQDLTDAMYQKLIRGVNLDEASQVGNARSEALARGVEGSAIESSGVNAAREAGATNRSNVGTDLALKLAGYGREERLGEKSRGYQVEDRNFGAAEAEKDRVFRQRLAEMGHNWNMDEQNNALTGQVVGALGGALGSGIGAFAGLGGLGGAGKAAKFTRPSMNEMLGIK